MKKKILLTSIVVLVAIQLIRLPKNNAETRVLKQFVTETNPTVEIQTILSKKCYDCHSNKTTYPWYSNIAPLSFWIDHHVEEGKKHLNFSDWSNYNAKRKKHKLDELIEEVEEGEMPLKSYELLHGDLTASEKELLLDWAKKAMAVY